MPDFAIVARICFWVVVCSWMVVVVVETQNFASIVIPIAIPIVQFINTISSVIRFINYNNTVYMIWHNHMNVQFYKWKMFRYF